VRRNHHEQAQSENDHLHGSCKHGWYFSFVGLPQAQRTPLFFTSLPVLELTPNMLRDEEPISQRHLEELEEFQECFRYLMGYLYHQLLEGHQIQPGKRTVNIPALMLQFPKIIITNEYEVRVAAEPFPKLTGEDFSAMQKLLSDDDVAELHRQGFHYAARARRLANRITYRWLLKLYARHTSELFCRRLRASIESGQKKTHSEIIGDILGTRSNILKLRLAVLAHLLHLPLVDPCDLVKSGMRGIAFILNKLAPLPPSWR
jgi:hypothetical protein